MQRILRSFVLHASVITPLSEAGKLHLAADMAQVSEISLFREYGPILLPIDGKNKHPLFSILKLSALHFVSKVELALAQLQRVGSIRLNDLGEPYHALR